MSNVVKLKLVNGVGDNFKVEANKVLKAARNQLEQCVVVGFQPDGKLYVATTDGDAEALWLLETAKAWLIAGCPEEAE